MSDLSYIQKRLSKEEILCQLAEEAAELSQAALKLRRAITQNNPTPKTEEEAEENLTEEIADVWVCLNALFEKGNHGAFMDSIFDCVCSKETRWAYRLKRGKRRSEKA